MSTACKSVDLGSTPGVASITYDLSVALPAENCLKTPVYGELLVQSAR